MSLLRKKYEIPGYDKKIEGDRIIFNLNDNYWSRENTTLNCLFRDFEKSGCKEFKIKGDEKYRKDLQYFTHLRIDEEDSKKYKVSIFDKNYLPGVISSIVFLLTTESYFEELSPGTHPLPHILSGFLVFDSIMIGTKKVRDKLKETETKKIDKRIGLLKNIKQELGKPDRAVFCCA